MRITALGEGVGIALDSIRANKLRSGLTILGVVIGVSTVMAMASIVNGIAVRSSMPSGRGPDDDSRAQFFVHQ
jgi:putative ABC transport system permease protein